MKVDFFLGGAIRPARILCHGRLDTALCALRCTGLYRSGSHWEKLSSVI